MPAGHHEIRLGPGVFRASRPARPRSGVTVAGAGAAGPAMTRLVPSDDWAARPPPAGGDPDDYFVVLARVTNVVLRGLAMMSGPDRWLDGAIRVRDAKDVAMESLWIEQFAWNGLLLEFSTGLRVSNCVVRNASVEKRPHHGGLIRTRWIRDSVVTRTTILSDVPNGYGYKGGGHEGVRIEANRIDVASEFSIESAHENEYGLDIAGNVLTRCVSVPKGGQGDLPSKRGFDHSVRIHHNLLTDSYTVEGPRNHLRLDHNHIRCERPGGRIYTHHGGVNHGPVLIDHNVIEQADRAFVWMNEGLAENLRALNNTVVFADAVERAGSILGAWSGERMNGWTVVNNIFICPASQPRELMPRARGVPDKITARRNICVSVHGAPPGNFEALDAEVRLEGDRPWPYFAPASADSLPVDRGEDAGQPYAGAAPDIGAYEWGAEPSVGPPGPVGSTLLP